MKPSYLIGLALLIGALAAYIAAEWLVTGEGPEIVVARVNISPGHVIAHEDLKLVPWPSAAVPDTSSTDINKLIGRVARQEIYPHEVVLETDLAPVGARGGLEAAIEPGKRAITVRVNDVIAVAGFAHPGSYVDVIVSAKDPKGEPFSMIVLNRVKILAIAQETLSDPTHPKVVNAVTLELTPEEAESLDLARTVGSLTLVLRNERDRDQAVTDGAQMRELYQRRIDGDSASPIMASKAGGTVTEMRGVGDSAK